MTVAEAVAEWLAEKEICHAFGIIGAGNLALWEAIARKGETEIVCCHHEQAAAMAATFYQRTSGRIAVCLVTTGAGSTNTITGVMAAFMDSSPLLVISGNETAYSLSCATRTLGVQGYASSFLAKPAKYSNHGFVKESQQIDPYHIRSNEELDRLLAVATSNRPGPVWIDIPRDVQVASL